VSYAELVDDVVQLTINETSGEREGGESEDMQQRSQGHKKKIQIIA
jgi:hypothetical protein